jgi:hypothetical protein
LRREVKALGFRGSYGTVYAYLRPFKGQAAPPAVPAPPKARHITSWIRRRPGNLDAGEQLELNQIRAACPGLDAPRGHVEEFAKMITGLHGDRLDSWIAAVLSGLTLAYSSGAAGGKAGKIKFWKGSCSAEPTSTCSGRWPSGTEPRAPTVTTPHQVRQIHLPPKITGEDSGFGEVPVDDRPPELPQSRFLPQSFCGRAQHHAPMHHEVRDSRPAGHFRDCFRRLNRSRAVIRR